MFRRNRGSALDNAGANVGDDGLADTTYNDRRGNEHLQQLEKAAEDDYESTKQKLEKKQEQLRKQAEEAAAAARTDMMMMDVEQKIHLMWQKVETTPMIHQTLPAPRSGHAAFSISASDPRIFVHGGAADSVYFDDLYALHTQTLKWSKVHTYLFPRKRAYHTVGLVGPSKEALEAGKERNAKPALPRLCMYGGFHKGTIDGDVHILDNWQVVKKGVKGANSMQAAPRKPKYEPPPGKDDDIWGEPPTAGDVPLPRCNHTATLVGGRHLVVYGGWHGDFVNDLYVLDVWTMDWEYKSTQLNSASQLGGPVSGRAGHTATLLPGKKLLVFGGQNGKGQLDDLLLLNLNTMEWTRPQPFGRVPSRRSGHTATYDGRGKVFIFGGWDGFRMRDDVHVLSVQGDPSVHWKWEELTITGAKVSPRVGHTASWVDGKLWIFGGWADGTFLNDVVTVEIAKSGIRSGDGLSGGKKDALSQGEVDKAAAALEENAFVEDFKKQLKTNKAHDSGQSRNDAELEYIQALNRQVDDELFKARNIIEERKLRAALAVREEEKSSKRRTAIAIAALRRRAIAAEVDAGRSLQDAVQIADKYSEEELLNDGIQVGRYSAGDALEKPAPPKEKHPDDLTPEERAELFEYHSAFIDNVDHVDELLDKIQGSGGLDNMWNGEWDEKQRELLARRAKIGEMGSNLEAALESEKLLREQLQQSRRPNQARAPPKVAVRPHRGEMGPEVIDIECLINQTPMPRVHHGMRIEGGSAGAGPSAPPPPPPPNMPYPGAAPPAAPGALEAIAETGGVGAGALMSPSVAGLINRQRGRPSYAIQSPGEEIRVPAGVQKALVAMQAAMRGYLERKRVRELRAALIMQKHLRGWRVRKRMQKNTKKVRSAFRKAALKSGKGVTRAFSGAATSRVNAERLAAAAAEQERLRAAEAMGPETPRPHDDVHREAGPPREKITQNGRALLRPVDG